MKRLLIVTAMLSLVYGHSQAWAQLPHFNSGDVLKASQLNTLIDHINALGGPSAEQRIITVDCAVGTIGQALDQANPGDMIQVTGTCHEAVRIIKDGITLDGQGLTTVDAGGSQQSAIVIDGAQRVTVQGLTVQHGENHGVLALRGAAVILHTVTAMNNVQDGIQVAENATAQVIDCTASQNGRDGIAVVLSSHATLGSMIVSQTNGRFGIRVAAGSFVFLVTGATVTVSGNTSNGILVQVSAALALNSNSVITLVVRDNQNRGIVVIENSVMGVFSGTLIVQNNVNGGVQVLRTSFMRLQPATGDTLAVQITGNKGRGVEIDQNSGAAIVGGTGATVDLHDNTGDGIGVFSDSYLDLQNVTVNHNGGAGINLSLSTATLTNVQLLDHANNSGLNLNDGSRVTANQLTVMNNTGGGISLFNGSSINLGNSVVSNNQGQIGLGLFDHCSANLNNVQISGHPNAFSGLNIGLNSTVNANDLMVTNNGHQGIAVEKTSGFESDGGLTVMNNSGGGINVDESHLRLQNATITGNGVDLSASFGARLTLNANAIGTIFCQPNGNVLSRGDRLCPAQ